ncbi:hypothetical protein KIPB_011955, partial [Kipferlia bialata]|eukprot:g11955.t1
MPAGQGPGDVKLVVGMDFGTTFSGYAISHKQKPEEVEAFFNWPSQPMPY